MSLLMEYLVYISVFLLLSVMIFYFVGSSQIKLLFHSSKANRIIALYKAKDLLEEDMHASMGSIRVIDNKQLTLGNTLWLADKGRLFRSENGSRRCLVATESCEFYLNDKQLNYQIGELEGVVKLRNRRV